MGNNLLKNNCNTGNLGGESLRGPAAPIGEGGMGSSSHPWQPGDPAPRLGLTGTRLLSIGALGQRVLVTSPQKPANLSAGRTPGPELQSRTFRCQPDPGAEGRGKHRSGIKPGKGASAELQRHQDGIAHEGSWTSIPFALGELEILQRVSSAGATPVAPSCPEPVGLGSRHKYI